MKILRLFRIAAKVMFLFVTFNQSVAADVPEYNDLARMTYVGIQAEAKVIYNLEAGSYELQVRIPNLYTNTIECSVDAPYGYFSPDGKAHARIASAYRLAVFPDLAFGKGVGYPIPYKLNQGEILDANSSLNFTANCRGWDMSKPLPREFCQSEENYPGHKATCELASLSASDRNNIRYPRMANGTYIGSCSCN